MYVNIKRRLFKDDPASRFGKVFKCQKTVWQETWKRYKILGYSNRETYEYTSAFVKIDRRRFSRWIKRTEVYIKAQLAYKAGARQVNIDYFCPYQHFIQQEISKNKWQNKLEKSLINKDILNKSGSNS